jgi:hypothetical protein
MRFRCSPFIYRTTRAMTCDNVDRPAMPATRGDVVMTKRARTRLRFSLRRLLTTVATLGILSWAPISLYKLYTYDRDVFDMLTGLFMALFVFVGVPLLLLLSRDPDDQLFKTK